MSNLFNAFLQGSKGESEVGSILSTWDDCIVISNMYLKVKDTTYQIDFVVVSTSGIYVIEVKNIKGLIRGKLSTFNWQVHSGNRVFKLYNPIMQNAYHIQALRKNFLDRPIYFNVVAFPDDTEVDVGKEQRVKSYSELYSLNIIPPQALTEEEVQKYGKELHAMKIKNMPLAVEHNEQQKKYRK